MPEYCLSVKLIILAWDLQGSRVVCSELSVDCCSNKPIKCGTDNAWFGIAWLHTLANNYQPIRWVLYFEERYGNQSTS